MNLNRAKINKAKHSQGISFAQCPVLLYPVGCTDRNCMGID